MVAALARGPEGAPTRTAGWPRASGSPPTARSGSTTCRRASTGSPSRSTNGPFGETGPFARLVRVFTVPPAPDGRSDEPLDLGVSRLRARVTLKPGDPAPAFEVTTVDGKKLAVPGDFRGKVLLLDFGTRWDMQSPLQITRLNDVRKRFGDDPRLAILSLTLAADTADTRAYVADKGEPWPQAIVGDLSNPIASAYGVHDENVWGATLIGPDGELIATGLYHGKIGKAVGEALGRK